MHRNTYLPVQVVHYLHSLLSLHYAPHGCLLELQNGVPHVCVELVLIELVTTQKLRAHLLDALLVLRTLLDAIQ
jgi:hypothetical protein